MNDKITEILSYWGLRDSYILKQYQDPVMLDRNLKILNILDERGIPVGQAVPAQDRKLYVSDGDSYYFLSRKLAGNKLLLSSWTSVGGGRT